MPRQARKKSESGIYHVILRGINKQVIFEDEEDSFFFLSLLRENKTISGYRLMAYCLMGNHIHLLFKVEGEPLDRIIRRIAGKYAYWYNNKYQRVGHLFQDRYKSEPVEGEDYLLTVTRYIHLNPVIAKAVNSPDEHPYSSYSDYLSGNTASLADTEFILDIVSKEEFIRFHTIICDNKCLEVTERRYYPTDEQARQIILKMAKCKVATDLQRFEPKDRNEILQNLKTQKLSIRQISRLTGISKSIVERS